MNALPLIEPDVAMRSKLDAYHFSREPETPCSYLAYFLRKQCVLDMHAWAMRHLAREEQSRRDAEATHP